MAGLLAWIVIGVSVITCVKLILSMKVLEKDPEAWVKLQEAEEAKRRCRQEMLAKGGLGLVNYVTSLFKKGE